MVTFSDPVKLEKNMHYHMYKRKEEIEDDTPPTPSANEDASQQKKRRQPRAIQTWVFHDGIGTEAGGVHMEGSEVARGPESSFILMQYESKEKICYATPVGDWVSLSRMKVRKDNVHHCMWSERVGGSIFLCYMSSIVEAQHQTIAAPPDPYHLLSTDLLSQIPKSSVLSIEEVEEMMKRGVSKAKPKKGQLLSQRDRVEQMLAKLEKDDEPDDSPSSKGGGKRKGLVKKEIDEGGSFKATEKEGEEGQDSSMLEGLARDDEDRQLLGLGEEGADYEQEFDDDDVDQDDENNAMMHHEVEGEGEEDEEEDEEEEDEEEEEEKEEEEEEEAKEGAAPTVGGKRPLEEGGEGPARPQKVGRKHIFTPGSVEARVRDIILAKVRISSKDLSRQIVQVSPVDRALRAIKDAVSMRA